ncbi:hypothetical protein V8E51_007946 [Hyaloscypha variabilis]
MCLTVHQRFNACDCMITRKMICGEHVNHTRKQVDNKPCPKTQYRYIEMEIGGCGTDDECKQRKGTIWVFDHFSPEQGDFTFLERPADYDEYPKCLDRGHFTRNHQCGVGKNVDGHWRHSDRGGSPFKTVNGGKKGEVKMEDEDVAVKEEGVVIKEEDVNMEG